LTIFQPRGPAGLVEG